MLDLHLAVEADLALGHGLSILVGGAEAHRIEEAQGRRDARERLRERLRLEPPAARFRKAALRNVETAAQ